MLGNTIKTFSYHLRSRDGRYSASLFLIDEIGIVEIINEKLGIKPQEKLSTGIIVKGIIINAMVFVSSPLYLFPHFFNDKATEHLLGGGFYQKILMTIAWCLFTRRFPPSRRSAK